MVTQFRGVFCGFLLLYYVAAHLVPFDQKPMLKEVDNPTVQIGQGKNATIALYAASRLFPDDLKDIYPLLAPRQACSDDALTSTIELAPDVCLSGDYYLRDCLKVLEEPACADGSKPKFEFYPNGGCTGNPLLSTSDMPAPQECLWSKKALPIPPYYWSLIYRCAAETDGAKSYQTTDLQKTVQALSKPTPGFLKFHNEWQCHSSRANSSSFFPRLVNGCYWPLSPLPLESIEILSPAVCADGSRAKMVLFEDTGVEPSKYGCNDYNITFENSFMIIQDSDIQQCLKISDLPLVRGGTGKALGFMFFCRNEKSEPDPKPPLAMGIVSHSICPTEIAPWTWEDSPRPPTFMYPKAKQCVNLAKGHGVRVLMGPVCPDGTPARLAIWEAHGCQNELPLSIQDVDRGILGGCLRWDRIDEMSYMFWCDGPATQSEDRGESERRAIFTLNGCAIEQGKGWLGPSTEETVAPIILRAGSERCIDMPLSVDWKIFSNAKCENGTEAKLAVWDSAYCTGSKYKVRDIDPSSVDKCMPVCEGRSSCSVAFWCDGWFGGQLDGLRSR